jgi:hypothetical protein
MISLIPKHKMAWRMRAVFADKLGPAEYVTPDVRLKNPGWADEIFNHDIESLEFYLPTGDSILLKGMEKYNFFAEAVQGLRSRSSAKIVAFWLCGKLPGRDVVDMWRVGNNKVIRVKKPWGREWGGGPTSGWKKGKTGDRVVSRIILKNKEAIYGDING